MGVMIALDGFIADDNEAVGPLVDWYGNGNVIWSFEGSDRDCQSTQAGPAGHQSLGSERRACTVVIYGCAHLTSRICRSVDQAGGRSRAAPARLIEIHGVAAGRHLIVTLPEWSGVGDVELADRIFCELPHYLA